MMSFLNLTRGDERNLEIANSAEQTFITVAVENDLPKAIKGSKFKVELGKVVAL